MDRLVPTNASKGDGETRGLCVKKTLTN